MATGRTEGNVQVEGENWALTLSGGGLRATLFHLGVVKALRASGDLAKVKAIFSVSGGSILAAHMRLHWERYSGTDDEFAAAATEVRKLCKRDLRGRVVRRSVLCWLLLIPPLLRLLAYVPGLGALRNGASSLAPAGFLVREFDRFYGYRKLPSIDPTAPSLHVLATSLNSGETCVFENDHIRLRRAGFVPAPAQLTPIAVAVAASAAYPALFAPLEINAERLIVRKEQFPETHYLSDGGLYDNLGLIEALRSESESGSRFSHLLVSDAGAAMSADMTRSAWGFFRRTVRVSDIFMSRIANATLAATERDDKARFSVVSIHRVIAASRVSENAQSTIGTVRTDLDVFSDREQAMIINHGYEACRDLRGAAATAARAEPATPTEPLLNSQKPNLWGLLDLRDWPTPVCVVLACLWVALIGYAVSYDDLKRDYAVYKHREFLRLGDASAALINPDAAQANWKDDVSKMQMTEFWGRGNHSDLSIAAQIWPLRAMTATHNSLARLAGASPPFPPLEHEALDQARKEAADETNRSRRQCRMIVYMHLVGDKWRRELEEPFKKERDDSYLRVLRVAEALVERAEMDSTASDLRTEFNRYYYGRLLPIESRAAVQGTESVEAAMVQFGRRLEAWRQSGGAQPSELLEAKNNLRDSVLRELQLPPATVERESISCLRL